MQRFSERKIYNHTNRTSTKILFETKKKKEKKKKKLTNQSTTLQTQQQAAMRMR